MKKYLKEFFSPINIYIRFVKDMKVALTDDPLKCCEYAEKELNGRFLLGEEVIAKSAECSLRYASKIMKGGFKLGEEAIAKNVYTSYFYAVEVLKGRFELGEEAIARECEWSYFYALEVMKGRFELGEIAIAESSRNSFRYAVDIIKGRFELGEEAILEDVVVSRVYLSFLLTILDKQQKVEQDVARWFKEKTECIERSEVFNRDYFGTFLDGVKPTGTIHPFGISDGNNISGLDRPIDIDTQMALDAKLNNSPRVLSVDIADPSGKDKMEIYRYHVKSDLST